MDDPAADAARKAEARRLTAAEVEILKGDPYARFRSPFPRDDSGLLIRFGLRPRPPEPWHPVAPTDDGSSE